MNDSALLTISAAVARVCGLVIPPQRLETLASAATERARLTTGGDIEAYGHLLSASVEEAEALSEILTIGETYFFRHWPDFETLAARHLPALIERERQGGSPPVLWSAACSTGEEAYSLAILARSLASTTRCLVLGTDLNGDRIGRAREAVYGDWSFRGTGGQLLEGNLEPQGDRLRVVEPVRRLTRFSRYNLLSTSPPPGIFPGSIDVVFLRNVLIYFDEPSALRAIATIEWALAPGGLLVVGSVEASLRCMAGFEWQPSQATACFVKRRAGEPPRGPADPPPAPRRVIAAPPPVAPRDEPASGNDPYDLLVSRAAMERRRGDREGFAGASRLALAAAKLRPLEALPVLIAALALLDLGAAAAALPIARKAAHLSPDDPMAQFALGRALEAGGYGAAAKVALRGAAQAAARLPPQQILSGGGDLTARGLLSRLSAAG